VDRGSPGTLRETPAQIFLIDTSNDGSYTALGVSRISRVPLFPLRGLCARPTHAVGIHGSSGYGSTCSSLSHLSHYNTVEGPGSHGMGKYITCSGSGADTSLYWLYGL